MKRLPVRTPAFSLVEVTLALGIAAFCLMAVFGLMPVGVQTNRNATSQTASTSILANVVSDLRRAPIPRPTPSPQQSSLYKIMIPAAGGANGTPQIFYFDENGRFATSLAAPSPSPWVPRYQLRVTFPTPPANNPGSTYADLKITWPAAADPSTITPSGSVEMFAVLDRH
jgi:uncharacterized protein (TIGR02598 family)